MNSRQAFKKTMQAANTERGVFVPIVYRLAARIEQTPLRSLASDATSYANALESAYKLLKQEAILTNFDTSLEAEIFGCRLEWRGDYDLPEVSGWVPIDLGKVNSDMNPRISVLLEATRRLVQTIGREAAIIGVVTGPCSMANNIANNARLEKDYSANNMIAIAGAQLTRFTRSLGEIKVDAVIFREDPLAEGYLNEFAAHERAYSAVYNTLFNLTRFYNASGLVMVKNTPMENLVSLPQKLALNGLVLSGCELKEHDLKALGEISTGRRLSIGLPLPLADVRECEVRLQKYHAFIRQNKSGGFYFTSDGEVQPDIPLENLHDIAAMIRGISESPRV